MRLKATWEVRAGVIPGQALHTRRWEYTSDLFDQDNGHKGVAYHSHFAKIRAEALDFYLQISLPHVSNWAEISFIWY